MKNNTPTIEEAMEEARYCLKEELNLDSSYVKILLKEIASLRQLSLDFQDRYNKLLKVSQGLRDRVSSR